MRLQTRIQRELKFLRGLVRTLLRVRTIRPDSTRLICDDIEAAVDAWIDSIDTDHELSVPSPSR